MDFEQEEIFDGLSIWLDSLELPSGPVTAESISTGLPIAETLKLIDPSYFNSNWIGKLSTDVEPNNWRVKSSNLRKVLKGISDYYEQTTGNALHFRPDVNKIAQDASKLELSRLLQLLVAVAVSCPRKEEFIPKIMQLAESVQKSVMTAVNEVEKTKVRNTAEEKIRHVTEELDRVKEDFQESSRRCFELDSQVSALQEENQMLLMENKRLRSRPSEGSDIEDPGSPAGRKLHQMNQTMDRLQEDLFKTETANEELQKSLEASQKENEELKGRVDELVSMEHQYRRLKDELDELRSKADDARKLESTLDVYRRKIEDQTDLKAQVKILEEKNENYMRSVIELEEEQRKNGNLKVQLESYKKQVQELEGKVQGEVRRADKAEFECKKIGDKWEAANQERQRLIGERDYWKEYAEELKAKEISVVAGSSSDGEVSSSTHSGLMAVGSNSDLKEQLLRLEAENRLLKGSGAGREEMELIQNQLDDALARKQELETENRLANQKILELGSRIEDLQQTEEESRVGGDQRLAAKHQEAEKLSVEMEKSRRRVAEQEKHSRELMDKIQDLKMQLEAKDSDLKASDAKFKLYMEKARTVITGLEQSETSRRSSMSNSNELSREDVSTLKRELEQKEKQIQRMQEEEEKTRIMKEQEERLITTAFHSMAMQLHRNAVQERLVGAAAGSGGTPALSFLSRQRQIVTNRRSQQQPQHQQSNASNFTVSLIRVILIALATICLFAYVIGSTNIVPYQFRFRSPLEIAVEILSEAVKSQVKMNYVDGPPPF